MILPKTITPLIAAFWAVFNFVDICFACKILTDSLSQSIGVFAIYQIAKFLLSLKSHPAWPSLFWGSVLLSIGILIRPSFLYLAACIALGLVVVMIVKKYYRQMIPAAMIILLIPSIPVFGWSLRNAHYTDYKGYSAISVQNLYYYNCAAVFAAENQTDYYTALDSLLKGEDEGLKPYLETMPKYDAMQARAIEVITGNLPVYLKECVKGVAYSLFVPGTYDTWSLFGDVQLHMAETKERWVSGDLGGVLRYFVDTPSALLTIFLLLSEVALLLILFATAVLGAVKTRPWYINAFLLGVGAYFLALSCQPIGIGGYPRYRMSFSMLLIFYSSIGLSVLWNHILKKKKEGNFQTEN